jgi:hypothetical protein
MTAALAEKRILPVILVEAGFDSGVTRAWNGVGELSWDSKTWYGLGTLMQIEEIKETKALQANSVRFTLNGIDPNILYIALAEDYQNRDIRAWFGLLDKDLETLIADPHLIFRGFMDVMEVATDGKSGTASINAENSLITAMQSKARFHTYEDQKSMYPTDEGEEFAATIEDVQITWGFS